MTCKECTLTAERLLELFAYDQQTGLFTRRISAGRHGRFAAGSVVGTLDKSTGYLRTRIDGRLYYLHRLAWFYVTGAWPRDLIDHKDGMKTANAFGNLREADKTLNLQNQRRASVRSRAQLLGVWSPTKPGAAFQAYIKADGKRVRLGRFPTAALAHEAYVKAKRQMHAGCSI